MLLRRRRLKMKALEARVRGTKGRRGRKFLAIAVALLVAVAESSGADGESDKSDGTVMVVAKSGTNGHTVTHTSGETRQKRAGGIVRV